MNHPDDLEVRVEQIISEMSAIIRCLRDGIGDSKRAVSFGQVKEIDGSIERLKRQSLPIPAELKELKLKLFSEHEHRQKCVALYQKLQQSIGELMEPSASLIPKKRGGKLKDKTAPYRKPYNYEKPLGIKGYSSLEDYLIPIVKLMWSGMTHRKAFRKIAQNLDVRYNTVSAQCTRALDLTTEDFINQVNSKTIISVLEKKYPHRHQQIKAELKA